MLKIEIRTRQKFKAAKILFFREEVAAIARSIFYRTMFSLQHIINCFTPLSFNLVDNLIQS